MTQSENRLERAGTDHSAFGPLAPRLHFPGLEQISYLNAAGIGLVAQPVQNAVCDFVRAIGSYGSQGYFERYYDIIERPRDVAAALLSAPRETIGVITSISEAISQIAMWRRPRADENIVMVDTDCSSATYPWIRAAQETGAELRFVRARNASGIVTPECVAAQMDRNTAAISISHVQWISGERLDLLALGEVARVNDALLVVDAMHSFGIMPFTPGELDAIDFLAAGSFKWLGGYAGAGAVYVNPRLLADFMPVMTGSRTSDPEPPFDEIDPTRWNLPPDARRFEYGSSIMVSRVSMAEAGQYLLDLGLENVIAHNQRLGDRLIAGLLELGGEVRTPAARNSRAAIVAARMPGADQRRLYEKLLRRNVQLSLRNDGLRFSPHIFNNSDDIDFALKVISEECS